MKVSLLFIFWTMVAVGSLRAQSVEDRKVILQDTIVIDEVGVSADQESIHRRY